MPRLAMRRRYDGCSAENRLIFDSSSTAFSGGIVERAGIAACSDTASAAAIGTPPTEDASVSSNSGSTSSSDPPSGWLGGSLMCRLLPEEALGVDGGHAAGAGRGHRLPVDVVGDVAAREHAGDL